MSNSVLSLKGLVRQFKQGDRTLRVLDHVDLDLKPGEIVALVGPSGSGKSTLLHTAGLLEKADGGQVIIDSKDCARLNDNKRTEIRRNVLGFVYQFHHLLPEFDALENIILPQLTNGIPYGAAESKAHELLGKVGLEKRANHRPSRMSGGEQQRVAIVRALANSPRILLADEPTGNLDEKTASEVFDYLVRIVREEKLAALIATHNMDLARKMDRIVTLHAGKLVG